MNRSFLENKATEASKKLKSATYKADRRSYTIKTYYQTLISAFNDLEIAGSAFALNEEMKVKKFEEGLKDSHAITYAIQAHYHSEPIDVDSDS